MGKLPKIDVVMPIGHWSAHLKATLASLKIQAQVFDLIIQDASEDQRVQTDIEASGLALKEYCKAPDQGQADAISKGWAKSDNEIVFWLNADDMLMPEVLAFVAKRFAQNPSLDVICGQSTISDTEGAILGRHPEVTIIGPLLKRSNIISQPSCFVRRTAMEDIGGIDPTLHYTMDWDLWLRLYLADKKFDFIDRVLSNVTWETGTKTSAVPAKRLKEIYRLLRRSNSGFAALKGIVGLMQHHRATYRGTTIELSTHAKEIEKFPVLNLTSSPQNRIKIDIEDLSAETQCLSSGAQIERQINGFVIHLEQPVQPAQCIAVTIECGAAARDVFKSARWV